MDCSPGKIKHVSIVIPTHNRAHTISRAVRSALAQNYPYVEVIVVDDDSRDETSDVIATIREQDSRVKYIWMPVRGGGQAARIEGIKNSTGEYVAFLDSDDELTPDSVEVRLKVFMNCAGETGLVYGDCAAESAMGPNIMHFPVLRGYSYSYLCRELCLCNYSVMMIHRSCFDQTGYPDASFPAWQDDDMALTIGKLYEIEHCGVVVAIGKSAGDDNISSSRRRQAVGCRMIVTKYRRDIIRHQGYFRLWLWQLRIVNAYLNAVRQDYERYQSRFQATHFRAKLWMYGSILGYKSITMISFLLYRYLQRHFDYIYA